MRNRWGLVGLIVALVAVLALSVTLAQTAPQSGTVKPKAAAAAPSQDLSGAWEPPFVYEDTAHLGVYGTPLRGAPPMTPWAQTKFATAHVGGVVGTGDEDNDPHLHCDPEGMPRMMGGLLEIIQIPGRILILLESDNSRRIIWTDGRALPKDPDPTWAGYSVGRWEGDTLVVDTIGFDDRSWLNGAGYPHSDAMHITERFRRADNDTLELNTTIEDPKAYTKPWVNNRKFKLKPKGYEFVEDLCVPSDEELFLKNVREPAAPKPSK